MRSNPLSIKRKMCFLLKSSLLSRFWNIRNTELTLSHANFQASYTVIDSCLVSRVTKVISYTDVFFPPFCFWSLSMPTHSGKCLIIDDHLLNWWYIRWSSLFTAKRVWGKSPELHRHLLNLCTSYPPLSNKRRQYHSIMCWCFTVSLFLTCLLRVHLLWCRMIVGSRPMSLSGHMTTRTTVT